MNSPPLRSNHRVLIIDDNPAIHDDIRKILDSVSEANPILQAAKASVFGETTARGAAKSFEIDCAVQGEEGVGLLRRAVDSGNSYALAFVDMRMPPGWDGVETIRHLWQVDPNLQVVLCTAYSDYRWEEIIQKLGLSANMVVLKKPFDNIEVLQLVHALVEKWHLNEQVRARLADLDFRVKQRTAELEQANQQLTQRMTQQARLEEQLRQALKMEAVGQLAAGVAHDFNNILTVILGHISLLDEGTDPLLVQESIREIRDSAERAATLVRQLLTFSRKQVIHQAPLQLTDVLMNISEILRRLLGEHITLQVRPAPALPMVNADVRMMEQAIINLAVNARDAMPNGGTLTLTAHEREVPPERSLQNPEARAGRFVCLTVADTGCGIAPEHLTHIFEPFFTTKEPGQGTGLGLASVYGIVKQHEGWIEVQSEVGSGSAFTLFLPVCSAEQIVLAHPQAPLQTGGGESILVVEDEAPVRRLIVDVLRKYGYHVREAESGVEALQIFRQRSSKIDLLLTDLVMPGGVGGVELATRLREQQPWLKVAYMTGYSEQIAGTDLDPSAKFRLLRKPFSAADLVRFVQTCVGEKRP